MKGKIKSGDLFIYEGEFKNDKLNGQGKKITRTLDLIIMIEEGEFIDNKIVKGKITLKDLMIYEGEFTDGKLNGQGKITSKDGYIQEGEFKNGKLNGQGKVTLNDGTVIEGKYKKGKYKKGNYQPPFAFLTKSTFFYLNSLKLTK